MLETSGEAIVKTVIKRLDLTLGILKQASEGDATVLVRLCQRSRYHVVNQHHSQGANGRKGAMVVITILMRARVCFKFKHRSI